MEKIIALALVLVVLLFATTVATTLISTPKINILGRASSIGNFVPFGDPIDGPGPPGLKGQTQGK